MFDQQLFESEVSVMTMSNGMMDINEISPSDFNVLNQRYNDEQDQDRSQVLFNYIILQTQAGKKHNGSDMTRNQTVLSQNKHTRP